VCVCVCVCVFEHTCTCCVGLACAYRSGRGAIGMRVCIVSVGLSCVSVYPYIRMRDSTCMYMCVFVYACVDECLRVHTMLVVQVGCFSCVVLIHFDVLRRLTQYNLHTADEMCVNF